MPGAAATHFFLDNEDWQPVTVAGPVGALLVKPFVDTLTVGPKEDRIAITVSPASIEVDGTES